ncbi:hypothetical protein PssvBMR4_gp51 [Pseudomonas phage MR4]|mgnify:CR=1 FL=1|uniref:Uncharacterized protein n=1 Tax=Pseudomonas phage MR4 TaxID=2711171 RepID=A0A6M3TAD5_9CAUD|nr:hypothetical protein PssvBMR4_gp51 [Pseudomonas phage MR4]
MSASNIPSLGGFTPVESLLKGGSAKDIFNPMNIWNDGVGVLQKPSSLLTKETLTGMGKDTEKSRTKAQEEADDAATKKSSRETNKWLNWTPEYSSTGSKTGLSI